MANQLQQFLTAINPFGKQPPQQELKKNLAGYIAPVQLQRIRQDVQTWREGVIEAENAWYPHRVKMQRLYIDTINNGHVSAAWERRKDLTMLRKWDFVDEKGKPVPEISDIFLDLVNGQSQNKTWFNKFLSYALDAQAFGYSLIALGDIEENAFPKLNIIKRWNVSPDRLNVTNFTYSISGAPFMDEPYADWHIYIPTVNEIGTSPSGYGFLYKVGIYEIFLRNLLGFNGDFVELFAQPYRVGKTDKTDTVELNAFENSLQQMGSSGYAITGTDDVIQFLETKLGGTGYLGYDNFEARLEKKISKLILGHADAMDSVPGKLGNTNGEDNPVQQAMSDKQTKDGAFVSNVVNNDLIPKMRKLGFMIPDRVVAVMKNDQEVKETNDAIISQSVEMKKGGLQMDSGYFTKQTGIPIAEDVAPAPAFTPSIKNKLEKIYNVHKH